jgi:hypothetical protein
MLHCGGKAASIEEIREHKTPPPNGRHFPLAHSKLIDSVSGMIESAGFEILRQTHALSHQGARYFGVMQIANGGGRESDYGWTVGLRNSDDKTFRASMVTGTRVFVCDNLAFSGNEIHVSRIHTRWAERDLNQMITRAVGMLGSRLVDMDRRIAAYKQFDLTDREAHDILIRSVDCGAITPKQLPGVLTQWRTPNHEEFAPRTVWSLFNAHTEIHKEIKNPNDLIKRGQALHGLMDMHCELISN